MAYCGYNQLHDPDTMACAARKEREHRALVNKYRAKDGAGRYIERPLGKDEQRKELLITIPLYLIGIPLLFSLPILVLVAILGL